MRTLALLTCCVAGALQLQSQQVVITVRGGPSSPAPIVALSGETAALLDSVRPEPGGIFRYAFVPGREPGIYRLALGRGNAIDFVLDGEDVEITTDVRNTADSLTVVRSERNRLYYAFRRLNRQYKTKSEILQMVLARYPHDDPYSVITQTTAAELQRNYLDFIRSAGVSPASSFIARYIRSAQLPVVDLTQTLDRQLAYLKAHALDSIDFTDEGLIRSDLFAGKAVEYLMYYRNPQLPKELLAKEFNSAVDSLLTRARVNAAVYRHVTAYLLDGFKQFGFEECISYILENYVIKDDLCLEGSGNTIQRMIDQRTHLPVGAVAPDFTLPDTSGQPVALHSVSGVKVLLVFYSSACPHCQTMIPRLASLAREKSGTLSVVAVSLDAGLDEWRAFIRLHALSWQNVIDMRGWSGEAAKAYFLYATPSMFLLDHDRKITGKPLTVEDLIRLL